VGVEYRVLGPLEAIVDGRSAELGAPRHRALLVLLLAQANTVVPVHRLIDEIWGDAPPASAANLVQGAVSHLRKVLGKDSIVTRGHGYAVQVEPDALDLHVFERRAQEGSIELERGDFEQAAATLAAAVDLWSGSALADLDGEPCVQSVARRLEDLRLLVTERRLEAELGRGRHADVLGELRELVRDHPLRESCHALLMRALYRAGHQAEALEAYRSARESLVEELGIEPGPALQELHGRMLRQDPTLLAGTAGGADVSAFVSEVTSRLGSILVFALDPSSLDLLSSIGEPLARRPEREIIMVATVAKADQLAAMGRALGERRELLVERGVAARAAAFTSLTPGADAARLASEHEADLLLVDAPDGLLEDARVLALLDQAPCDVAVLAGARAGQPVPTGEGGSVLVPFGGASHDWAAVELGAWLALNTDAPLRLAGASGSYGGRDASRLLASASLAVQRAFGVPAEPLLVDPDADALAAAAENAGVVAVGLTERWRREGLGRSRTALAARESGATVLVRRGVRPGGLAPRESDTRFTWTLASLP
jgi:DNA-binding SARP family transcriptional activator